MKRLSAKKIIKHTVKRNRKPKQTISQDKRLEFIEQLKQHYRIMDLLGY